MAKRGNYAAGTIRRKEILDAATLHFAKGGYYATSLSSIARDIGITTAGLMHHFPTKQHLLVALSDHRMAMLRDWSPPGGPEDGLEFWRKRVEMSRRMAAKPGLVELFVVIAFAAADSTNPINDFYRERYSNIINIHAKPYQEGIERGIFTPGIDCQALASECIAIVDGFQLQWALSHGSLDLAASVKRHHEQQLRSIAMPGVEIDLSLQTKTGTPPRSKPKQVS